MDRSLRLILRTSAVSSSSMAMAKVSVSVRGANVGVTEVSMTMTEICVSMGAVPCVSMPGLAMAMDHAHEHHGK